MSHEAAHAAIELAESAGLVLDESQCSVLEAWLGERADGSWAAFEACHFMPRQNGKGSELEARQLAGLFVFDEKLQIHTAHEFKTANEHFLRMAALVEGSPDLRRKVARIRYANGEQGIELKSGARLKFMARSGGSGRGFAGAAAVYYDEAMYLASTMVGGSLPTLSVYWNPQVIYTGSGGFGHSSQMHSLRRRALSGDGGRLAYVEHTAEHPRLSGGVVASDAGDIDVADRELWHEANPTLGDRIRLEFVENEYRTMDRAEFLRERLCVWEPEPAEAKERVFTTAQWLHELNVTVDAAGDPVAYGLDVSPDRATAAIGACSASRQFGVIDHRPGLGLGWVRDRVDELVARHPNVPWVVDAGSAANGLLSDAKALTAREMAQACGALYDAVLEHRVKYRRQQALEDAVQCAARKDLSDAWRWDRRDSTGDITPLVAVTLALAGASLSPLVTVASYVDPWGDE